MARTAYDLSDDELDQLISAKSVKNTAPASAPKRRTANDLSNQELDDLIAKKSQPTPEEPSFLDKVGTQAKGLAAGASIPGEKYLYAATEIPKLKYSPLGFGGLTAATDLIAGKIQGKPLKQIASEFRQAKQETEGQPFSWDDFKKNAEHYSETTNKWREDAPAAAFIGGIPKDVAMFEGAGGAVSKLVPGLNAVKSGRLLPEALKGAARSGLASGITGQAESVIDRGELNPKKLAIDTLAGGAIDLGTSLGAEGLKAGYKGLKKAIDTKVLPGRIRSAVESIPGIGGFIKGGREVKQKVFQEAETLRKDAFKKGEKARLGQYKADLKNMKQGFADTEAARKLAYDTEKQAARESIENLKKLDDIQAGTSLSKSVKDADIALGKEYKAQTAPIFKKYSLKTISPDSLRQEVNSIFKENNLMDDKGNILRGELENILAPNRKAMLSKLADISESIRKNPSLTKMNKLVQDIGSLANFKGMSRSSEDEVFGKLYRSAKDSMMDGIEKVAQKKDAQALRAARAKFAKNKPIFEDLGAASDVNRMFPEKIVAGAKGKLPQSFINDVLNEQPSLKGPIAEVVRNNIAQSATSPKAFTKAIDSFGRDNLKSLLGEKGFQEVIEAENRLLLSSRPFVRGKMAKVDPFVPGDFKPGQDPTDELNVVYKYLSDILGKRKPGRILKKVNKVKYLAPSLSRAADLGEIEVN